MFVYKMLCIQFIVKNLEVEKIFNSSVEYFSIGRLNPEEYNLLHYTPIETHLTGVSYTLAYCYAD